ncbi:MAG TPA: HD domain-containing phosphohydrolase [Labilithrix sp.]
MITSQVNGGVDRAEEILIDSELFSEADLLKALSGIYRTHFVSTDKLAKADIPRATVQMIPKRVAETLGVFPVLFDRGSGALSVVTPDPENQQLLEEVRLVSGAKAVKAFVARPAAINAAIRKHHDGDLHAFSLLEAGALANNFGHQIGRDGRITAAKESFRKQSGSQPDVDPQPMRGREPSRPDAFDLPPAQARRPPSFRGDDGPRPTSLSAPPPPPESEAPPKPVAAKAPPASIPGIGPKPARRAPEVHPSPEPPPKPQPARHPSSLPPSGLSAQFSADTTLELLMVLVSLLENSRQELRGHSSQVARLLKRIAERMSLDRTELYAVMIAGHIHDIGKMGQFHLTGLNCSEYEGHRAAATKAYDTPLRLLEAVRFPPSIKNAVFHMYERYDGKGFPDKLVGKEIPLGARLLAVADTYADLTQNPRNPFRKVLAPAEAMQVLVQHKGTIFDPAILDLIKTLVLGEDMKAKLLANRHRALIIDSDPEESTVLELRMVEQGFDVRTARTIDAARKLLSSDEADFELVVCEVELPDENGLAFLSEARKEPWGRDLPWVVHTAKQGRTEAQRAFDLGAMDFVAKPVQTDVLVAKLKAMLDQWSARKPSKGVTGNLKEMGLPDMVQVLFHGRKTGRLEIRSAGKSGEIHFLEGNIAQAKLGEINGTDAFYAMLRFQEGDFELDPSFTPPERVIQESSEALLLEGMRRMDEGI